MTDLEKRKIYNDILLDFIQTILKENPQLRLGQLMDSIIFPTSDTFNRFHEEPYETVKRIKKRLEKIQLNKYLETLKDIENQYIK